MTWISPNFSRCEETNSSKGCDYNQTVASEGVLTIHWRQMLVLAKERQWFHDPHIFLTHPEDQTDSFILMVKASVILSKVKNFNLRYRARCFAKDPDYIPTVKAPTQMNSEVMDPRSCSAFIELDDLVSSFRSSFPSDLRNPIIGNVVDIHLFTACTIPHMYVIFPDCSHPLLRDDILAGP